MVEAKVVAEEEILTVSTRHFLTNNKTKRTTTITATAAPAMYISPEKIIKIKKENYLAL